MLSLGLWIMHSIVLSIKILILGLGFKLSFYFKLWIEVLI
jgi:hypothetical protein